MPGKSKQSDNDNDLPNWDIYVLQGSPAKLGAWVSAKDAEAAVDAAIKQFDLKEPKQRLLAVRRGQLL